MAPPLRLQGSCADVSAFHFHDIYRELMGETVAETLRRVLRRRD